MCNASLTSPFLIHSVSQISLLPFLPNVRMHLLCLYPLDNRNNSKLESFVWGYNLITFNSNVLNIFFLQQYLIFNTLSRHLALKESFNSNPVENCCHIDKNYWIYFFMRWWIMYHGEFMVFHSMQSRSISFWSWKEPSMNLWVWGRQPWEPCPWQRLALGKCPGRGAALVQCCSERDIAELWAVLGIVMY